MGRQALVEQRRIEIGRALEDCIVEKGSYESTSIKDIAEKNGMAAGIIHHYFESKEEILDMMINLELRERTNLIDDYLSNEGDRRESFNDFISNHRSNKFITICDALSLSIPSVKAAFEKANAEVMEMLKEALGEESTEQKCTEIFLILEFMAFLSAKGDIPDYMASQVFANLESSLSK